VDWDQDDMDALAVLHRDFNQQFDGPVVRSDARYWRGYLCVAYGANLTRLVLRQGRVVGLFSVAEDGRVLDFFGCDATCVLAAMGALFPPGALFSMPLPVLGACGLAAVSQSLDAGFMRSGDVLQTLSPDRFVFWPADSF
jgi:hypothetical protein